MSECFKIINTDKKTKARVGTLTTKSGIYETPFFMPVSTNASVKAISTDDLDSMGVRNIISNALILSLRPGTQVVKKAGGIGKFMTFTGSVFTDSGGFQAYNKKLYQNADEHGVTFKNPFNGDVVYMTPKKNMQTQLDIGSDVAMCLDSMPLYGESKDSILEAIKKTTRWAMECKEAHDALQKKVKKEKKQLLFGICQGGTYADLREISAKEIGKIDFDGFALGGLALGEPQYKELEMIEVAKKYLPKDKICYLMGAGNPLELLEAISRGVDIFDSRFPTKNARTGALFTWKGNLRVTNAKHILDFKPIDEKCECFVCKRYTRAYLRQLLKQNEMAGMRLVSYHNVFFVNALMKKARESIKKGTFTKLLQDFRKSYHK